MSENSKFSLERIYQQADAKAWELAEIFQKLSPTIDRGEWFHFVRVIQQAS